MCDWICQVRTVCMRVRDSLEWCIVNTQREVRIKKKTSTLCIVDCIQQLSKAYGCLLLCYCMICLNILLELNSLRNLFSYEVKAFMRQSLHLETEAVVSEGKQFL